MKIKLMTAAFSLITALSLNAAEFTGKVTNMYIKKDGLVMFKLGSSAPQECLSTHWPFKFSLQDNIVGEEWLELLNKADSEDLTISVAYFEDSPNSCDIEYIYFLNQ